MSGEALKAIAFARIRDGETFYIDLSNEFAVWLGFGDGNDEPVVISVKDGQLIISNKVHKTLFCAGARVVSAEED